MLAGNDVNFLSCLVLAVVLGQHSSSLSESNGPAARLQPAGWSDVVFLLSWSKVSYYVHITCLWCQHDAASILQLKSYCSPCKLTACTVW